jgi:hypothetical protein
MRVTNMGLLPQAELFKEKQIQKTDGYQDRAAASLIYNTGK